MGRNCSLELRLVPGEYDIDDRSRGREEREEKLTIFYDGRVNICDVTQFQARAIISLASKEMEEKLKSILGSETSSPSSPLPKSPACFVTGTNTNTGLSMKRSLQRFLQKRKSRIQSTAPYNLYYN